MARHPHEKPIVQEYLDYRIFLRDFVYFLKSKKKFTVRGFAEAAGFGSSNYLKMVMDGKRNLTNDSAFRMAFALGLNKTEMLYFEALVDFNQTKDLSKKDELYRKLIEHGRTGKSRKLLLNEFDILSHWYYIAIREALFTELSDQSESKIAEALGMDTDLVKDALKRLRDMGFIRKSKNGWEATETESLQVSPEARQVIVRNYHREMIKKALDALDSLDTNERNITGTTIALTKENYRKVVERISQLRTEIVSKYQDEKGEKRVYQFNFQAFPLLFWKK